MNLKEIKKEEYQRLIIENEYLKSENKELKEKNNVLEIRANELNGIAEITERDYIPKSKVEEKIEELKDTMLSSENYNKFCEKRYAYTVLCHLIYDETNDNHIPHID